MENGFVTDYPYDHHSVNDFTILANERLNDFDSSMKSQITNLRLAGHCGIIQTTHELNFADHNLVQLQHLIIGGFAFGYCRNIVFTSKNRIISNQSIIMIRFTQTANHHSGYWRNDQLSSS